MNSILLQAQKILETGFEKYIDKIYFSLGTDDRVWKHNQLWKYSAKGRGL